MNELVIVPCPPLSIYPEAPKDQSHSELFDCPECKEKMWLSEKKKGILLFNSLCNNEILLACYHCITRITEKEPELILSAERVDI